MPRQGAHDEDGAQVARGSPGPDRRTHHAGRTHPNDHPSPSPFAHAIGRTRFVVLIAVAGVLLVALTLFVIGAGMAVVGVWQAGQAVVHGEFGSTDLTVQLLEIVSVMFKAVVFFVVGVGLYSLFIAPLNVTSALGIETFDDLESRIISVVIIILSITFLERFIAWQQAVETLLFGLALAAVVGALVFFQRHLHQVAEDQRQAAEERLNDAQRELFEHDEEQRDIEPPSHATGRKADGRS